MNNFISRNATRIRRASRARSKMLGTAERPRLVVFRSLKHYTLALINDADSQTLGAVSTQNQAAKGLAAEKRTEWLGDEVAKLILKHKIKAIIFDRAGYKYHGNIAKIAEIIKKQGITI